jgi:GTP pyrophosphokinase
VIKICSVDKPGLLAQLSRAMTLAGVNISEAQCKTTRDAKAVNFFTVSVDDLNHLRKLIQRLEELEGVISVERVKRGEEV